MERFTLRAFFFCMPLTAALVLVAIWTNGDHTWPVWLFKLIPTTFVVGLASFLVWFTTILRRIAAR